MLPRNTLATSKSTAIIDKTSYVFSFFVVFRCSGLIHHSLLIWTALSCRKTYLEGTGYVVSASAWKFILLKRGKYPFVISTISLQDLINIQTLWHLIPLHFVDVHPGRSAKVLTVVYIVILTTHLFSLDHDQLRHRMSHAARIHFSANKSSVLWKKQLGFNNSRHAGISIGDQWSYRFYLLRNTAHPRNVLMLHSHQYFES